MLERQFVRYYDKAKKMQGVTGQNMLILLEQRLDNLVYRIGFGNSIRQARQMVNHGHILVNGRRVDIPSYSCKPGDVIELREASRDNEMFKTNFQELRSFELPYIEKDLKASKLLSLVFLNVKNFLSKLTKHLSSNCTRNKTYSSTKYRKHSAYAYRHCAFCFFYLISKMMKLKCSNKTKLFIKKLYLCYSVDRKIMI